MKSTDDIDAAFEDIVLAENQFQQEGYSVGLRQGRASGYVDGYSTGQKQGAKLGAEIGFYRGFAKSWMVMMENDGSRKLKALQGLTSATEKIPSCPTDPTLQDQVTAMRSKFKQVCAVHGIKSTFGNDKGSFSF